MKRAAVAAFLAAVVVSLPAIGITRLHAAQRVAVWRWGTVCHGSSVSIFNAPLRSPLIAFASWNQGRTSCNITYSTRVHWAWWSLCRATVHEYGHLAGAHHSRNPAAVMFAWTIEPWGPCGPDHNHPRLSYGL